MQKESDILKIKEFALLFELFKHNIY